MLSDTNPLCLAYPAGDHADDLAELVADLEESWGPPSPATEWPVEIAARICPVFRFIAGGNQ